MPEDQVPGTAPIPSEQWDPKAYAKAADAYPVPQDSGGTPDPNAGGPEGRPSRPVSRFDHEEADAC